MSTDTFYGYLVHVPWKIQEVLRRNPSYRTRVQCNGLKAWFPSMLSFAAESFKEECGLESLRVRPAWVGNGRTSFCWILPPNMKKKHLSSQDKQALDTFKALIGVVNKPVTFYPAEDPEPLYLRNIGPFRKDVEEMLFDTCYARFKSGELLSDGISLDRGMVKLTVKAR